MSAGLGSCLLSVPGPDKNRQAGLGRPVWNRHHGHLLTAIITGTPASHRYRIQTQLGAPHVPLQPAITNTPAGPETPGLDSHRTTTSKAPPLPPVGPD
ncbi:unnamed protein product [Arctogadus glacialis]